MGLRSGRSAGVGPRPAGGTRPDARSSPADTALRIATAFLSVVVLTGPFAVGSEAAPERVPDCAEPGRITAHPVNWYSIAVPRFPSGDQIITDHAVDTLAPDRLYVTNGETVLRSVDAGCTWSLSFSLADAAPGLTPANSHILELEAGSPGVVYLPIQQLGPAPRPHVFVTTDAGATWSEGGGPILNTAIGLIRDLDASHGNPSAAALLLDVEASEPGAVTLESGQLLMATDTAGQVWEPREFVDRGVSITTPVSSSRVTGEGFDAIAMNPLRPNEVWLYGENGVALYNGSLAAASIPAASVLDVSLDGQAVLAYSRDVPSGYLSLDGGASFAQFQTGFPVDSLDMSVGIPTLAALGGSGRVYYQYIFPGQLPQIFDVSPGDGRPVSNLKMGIVDNAQVPWLYGRTARTIEVAYEPVGTTVDVDEVKAYIPPLPDHIASNRLTPRSTTVTLARGRTRTIPYDLALPAANTPLDVYFMIDISGSMQGAINGIRSAMQEIVQRLSALKLDVRFGVGSFRSYNDPPAYDRVRDIGPSDNALAAALNSLRAAGGGAETQMAALMQSVTGDGDHTIPADLNMNFRRGSLRVAIEVTDEPISQGGQHPHYTDVIDALVEHDVKQVGLAIQAPPLLGEPDYNNPGAPADILQHVASGSGATVPPGETVDCDGDGDAELFQDDPIVCMVAPGAADDAALMAGAIVSVLQAVRDVQDLTVEVLPAADASASTRVLEMIDPSVLPQVDLKEPTQRSFAVTVRCPYVPRRSVFPLRVSASHPGGVLASASLTVVCKGPPPEEKAAIRIFPAFVPVAVVPPPPPRPPDPVPNPNPNPNPNPQQNPQAQAGFAAQEQQQPQVALAHQQAPLPASEHAPADEYLMSAHDEQSRVPPVGFIFAAGAITSVYAYAMAMRQRPRTAHAGSGRRKRTQQRRNHGN